jgi:hypothetical protein
VLYRSSISGIAFLATLGVMIADAQAWDDTKYPDFSGQWRSIGGPGRYDQSQPRGGPTPAPFTPEYQAIFDAIRSEGGQGTSNMTYRCWSPGCRALPWLRRDGIRRDTENDPHSGRSYLRQSTHLHGRAALAGDDDTHPSWLLNRSMGRYRWDGRYDVLEIETRGFRGPRAYDASGMPLHFDNQSIIKEKIFIDKADPNIAHDEVTVIDNALTRPWTVMKNYRRNAEPYPVWNEENCPETNNHVVVGEDDYMLSGEGFLMPTKKGQAPPDLRYFK